MDVSFVVTYVVAIGGCVVLWIDRRRLLREAARSAERIRALEALVYIDELTQIGNRRLFDRELETLVAHTLRAGESLGIITVDLNGLKEVNDSRGHPVGDRMVCALANVLRNSIRPTDYACRVGGDEFAVVLPACSPDGLRVVTERIIANLRTACVIDGAAQIPVRASLGGATLHVRDGHAFVGNTRVGNANSRSTRAHAERILVQTTDLALYDAKSRKSLEEMPSTLR